MGIRRVLILLCTIWGLLLSSAWAIPVDPDPVKPFTVVLDAGHGGHDPGNLGNGFLEKNIALNIVLEIGKQLNKHQDIEVVYTRDDDTFVDLYVRGEIANKAKADLFVSVHCDSHTSNAHGAGTFVLGLHANQQNFEIAKKENSVIYLEDNYESRYADYDINSPESVIGLTIMQEEFLDQSIYLGKLVQDNFTQELKRNDRKVKQAGFIVLHQTFMPSVLIETGFLTNKDEGTYLNSSKGQQEMGRAIAGAILKYKETVGPRPVDASSTPVPAEVKQEVVVQNKASEPVTPTIEKAKEVAETFEKPAVETSQPTQTAEKKEDPLNSNVGAANLKTHPSVVFKVQLMATSKDVELKPENFNGLNKLSKEPVNNLFRILYGETQSYMQAKLLKSNADVKGYTTSYIVAYKDGKRVPVKTALDYLSSL